jgi:Tfp pilus assembly protein PilV
MKKLKNFFGLVSKKTKTSQSGSSLIEILIALAVVSVTLTAIATALTYSVKITAEAKYRSLATNKAQEAIEMFRRERTILGWDEFYSTISNDGSSPTYCLDSLPAASINDQTEFAEMSNAACGESAYELEVENLGVAYKREAEVTVNADSILVEVYVYWPGENDLVHQVYTSYKFKEW